MEEQLVQPQGESASSNENVKKNDVKEEENAREEAAGNMLQHDAQAVRTDDDQSVASAASESVTSAQIGSRGGVGWRMLSAGDLKRAREREEARAMLELEIETDHNAELEGRLVDGLKLTEAEDSAAEQTAFGLPRVELSAHNSSQRRSSLTKALQVVAAMTADTVRVKKSRVAVEPLGPHAMAIVAANKKRWIAVREGFWQLAILLDAIYVLVSVPFRIGFLYDPWDNRYRSGGGTWTSDLTLFTALDIAGELCRWRYTWKIAQVVYSRHTRKVGRLSNPKRRVSSVNPTLMAKSLAARPQRGSLFSVRSERSHHAAELRGFDAMESFEGLSKATEQQAMTSTPSAVVLLLGIIPLELIAVLVNTNWLHLARLGKFGLVGYTLISSYSALLIKCRRYPSVQWLSFSTLATPFYLFWIGLFLCHLSACGYMMLANYACGLQSQFCIKTPVPGSWVLKDNMEQAHLWRRYVRTMYWASKTITTLGQGDLVPTTLVETNYCIVVQFISGLWATAFLASCTFYFSRIDRNLEDGVSTRLEQALRFLQSRKVPSTLSTQIRNYYQHIRRTRNGVEEDQVLANLPEHYKFQCAFFVKYRLVAKVPFFTKQPKAFVRTVVGALESDFLSPKGVVVALYAIEELIIVSQGNILVLNQHKELTHVLSAEEWFGEDALFEDRRSQFELEAKTFCEIFRLSRPVFIACMEKHFPKLRIAALMVKQQRPSAPSTSPSLQPVRPTVVKPGNSALLKLISQRGEVKPWSWHHPNSNFRKQWRRWKVLFLLFLAVEVPYEIAFKWRRGFFGDDVTLSQQGIYLMAFATELFFYVDWYFRVFKFSRRSPGRDDPTGPSDPHQHDRTQKSIRAAVVQKRDDLVTQPRELFRLYISSDDVVFDVVSIAPISVVWNLVNRSAYGVLLREIMRSTRLLALCRIFALKPLMKKIMVEFDFSPASHMLTNVMVFCVIAANGMACYFYLLADDKDFLDALPLGFEERSSSITSQMCLEHATLFGNCTWFMYDRSAFDIHARYVRSLHWSLVLLSTVGYGDIVSFTNSECLIGFWWIYLGAMICYYTSCAVGSVISQVTVLRSARGDRVEEIMRALIRSNVSPATRAMIRSYYEANWEFNGSVIREDYLMKRLPLSLRHQLASTLYLHALRKCYIFSGFGGQLHIVQEVALAMTSIVVLPGLPIVESGHLGESLYLVLSGEMEVLLPIRYRGGSIVTAKQMAFMKKRQAWGPICAALNRWSRTVFSRRSVMDLSSSTDELLAAMATSMIRSRGQGQRRTREVPVAVLKEGDCFGDEALLLQDHRAMSVTVRALTSAQIGVLHRNVFVSLSNRFPVQLAQMIALIQERYDENQALHKTIRRSLEDRDKIRDYLGNCRSAFVETITSGIGIITPDQTFYRVWRLVHGFFVFYNFYQITFRLAFAPYPAATTMLKLSVVDYGIDVFFYVDMYLKWNRFGFDRYGETVTDVFEIRRQYKQGWFRIDCLSMVPLYYYGDFFAMTLARLPRLLKSPQLLEYINEIEAVIREKFTKGSTTMVSVFDLVKFLAYFLSAAHHIGSVYFLLGRVLTTYEFSGFSWMTVDFVINANPDSVLVHYNRAIYWCLETFTVVCFGDVLARNAVETVYASSTCIIGWMCIGQVVGRITSLMASIDMELKEHNVRLDNLEQYAHKRCLPQFLRERASESVEYKSKCLDELKMRSIFDDLPHALHVMLFEELYGGILRGVPELMEMCSSAQIRVLANAFELEIYVSDDIIIEEGRLGTKLFVMKEGRAEYFSARSKVVFAGVHDGVIFGDLAFFLTGMRHFASVRASRSCQVLQLTRSKWNTLWSDDARLSLEAKVTPTMRSKHRSVALAFLNITKNLELSRANGQGLQSNFSLRDAHVEFGASSRSLQSSGGGVPTHPDNGSSAIATSVASLAITKVFGTFLHLTRPSSGVAPANASLNRMSLTRRSNKKKSTPSGGQQRKLLSVLGIGNARQLHRGDFEQQVTSDVQWKRHENNLRVLNFIDARFQQRPQANRAVVAHSVNLDRRDLSSHSADTTRPSRGAAASSKVGILPVLALVDTPPPQRRLSKRLETDVADVSNEHSMLSSTRSVGSEGHGNEPDPTSYEEHMRNLKMRSIRRQRRSIFNSIKGQAATSDETINPFEIWFEPPLPPSFCLESSGFRRIWNAIMYAICLYYVIVVPFRVSFDFEYLSSPMTNGMTTAWFAIEYVMDALCIVDFVLQRNYFTYVHRGTLVTDAGSIRSHYLREGTMVVDLVCILPLEVFIPLAPFLSSVHGSTTSKFTWYRLAVFRLNKMVRIAHLHSLGDKLQRMLMYDVPTVSKFVRPSVIYFMRFAFDFALGAHWVACLFYGAAFNTFQDGVPSWLTTAGMLTFEGLATESDIGHVSVIHKYARAYHYSMGAITTVSYGDIAPQNAWETFVGTFVIVISIVLFGMLSGGFSQVLELELGQRANYEEKISSVAHFMMFHRFPARIWSHMQSYFMVHWKESQGMNEDELLDGLPLSVKRDITLFVKRDFVKQLRLFAGCDEAFVRAAVVALEQELFIRNDVMVSYGERGRRCLYVIESGHVLVRVPKRIETLARDQRATTELEPQQQDGGIDATLRTGRMTFSQGADIEIVKGRFDFFGEKSLIFDVPRSATCIALSSCSMLILTLEKYEKILLEFPEYREKNMNDWIFANARENTPASAIRTPRC